MLNNYAVLYLSAIVAFIHSVPINITNSNNEEDNYANRNKIVSFDIDKKTYSTTQHIKTASIVYRQVIKDDKCIVEYDDQLYVEGSVIKIKRKLFRVEDCLLERVYHACGPKLLLMLSVVCRVVEQHKTQNDIFNSKRSSNFVSNHHLHSAEQQTKRIIAESCCEDFCNVSELTRYCH